MLNVSLEIGSALENLTFSSRIWRTRGEARFRPVYGGLDGKFSLNILMAIEAESSAIIFTYQEIMKLFLRYASIVALL